MVPNGWKQTTIEKVLTIGGGKDYKHLDKGSIPVYGSGGYMLSVSDYLYDGESVCIGRKGTIDNPLFLKGKFWTVDTLFFTHSFKGVEPYYIYQFFQTVPWRKLNEASGVPSLSKSIINKIKINLPPLPEQRKIAAILSTWDKAITITEQLLANSQQQKKALMQQLLTGKKRLLDENGERFRGEWKWLKVSDLLKVRKEKQVPTENVPLFSLTIEDGITPKSERYNREFLVKNTDEKKYKLVKPKDIVYNPANLRWGAINFSRIDYSVVVSPIYEVLFLKDENKTSLEFIAQKLMTPDQIGRFAAMVEGTLVERMAVKIEPFLATKLSVPPTLEEQQKIAAVLTNADQEIEALQNKLEALKQEKKALMQQLLTGKRRVKVDEVAA